MFPSADEEADSAPSLSGNNDRQDISNSTNGVDGNPTSHESDDIEVSDVDSDLDPDEMLSTYLRTKLRLFERNPDLAQDARPNGKRAAKQSHSNGSAVHGPSPGEMKLQQRLKTLEGDVLFDKYRAESQWFEQRNELLRDRAERKRLRIEDDVQSQPQAPSNGKSAPDGSKDIMDEAEEMGRKLLEEADGDDELLGGMFEPPTPTSKARPQDAVPDSPELVIRNFGKLSGMTPRRILEDACRSRYDERTNIIHLHLLTDVQRLQGADQVQVDFSYYLLQPPFYNNRVVQGTTSR